MAKKLTIEDLKKLSREELYEIAQELKIKGRSKLTKAELISNLSPLATTLSAKVLSNKKMIAGTEKKVDAKKTKSKTEQKIGNKEAPIEKKAVKTKKIETAAKKTPAKKAVAAKPVATKAPAKKAAAEKPVATKAPAKKAAAEKPVDTKAPAKKAAAAKPVATKAPAKKAAAAKPVATKVPAKKAAAEKPVATKVPAKSAPAKKPAATEAPAKKAVAAKPVATKAPAKKAAAEKPVATEAPSKKAAAAKPVATKAPAKKAAAAKPVATKVPAKKAAAAKPVDTKAPAKSAPAKKPAAKNSKAKKSVVSDNQTPEEVGNAESASPRLSRSFAKQKKATASRKKQGAVMQPVAVEVDLHTTLKDEKPTIKAQQIEEERSKRHSTLKTTMEIPVFSVPLPESATPISDGDLTGDLPADYGETRIVVQVRDPHWAHAYWQIPKSMLKRLELEVGIFEFAHSQFVIKVHNVTDGFSKEFQLSNNARSHYFYLSAGNTVYQAELGLQSPTEGYTFIALSNLIQTPPDQVSEHWAAPVASKSAKKEGRIAGHELYPEEKPIETKVVEALPTSTNPGVPALTDPKIVYATSVSGGDLPAILTEESGSGFPQSLISGLPEEFPTNAPVGIIGQPANLFDMPDSWNPSSHSLSSFSKATETKGAMKEPFLSASVEMILYGYIETNFELSFNGLPIEVSPDGSYSLRIQLPQNQGREIELEAVDPLTKKKKTIRASVKFEIL